jgi:hypothetical protein
VLMSWAHHQIHIGTRSIKYRPFGRQIPHPCRLVFRTSRVNEEMVNMVYNQEFDSVSLFAIDSMALSGLTLFSVLRNHVVSGQSAIATDEEDPSCGRDLNMSRMGTSIALPIFWYITLCIVYGIMLALVIVMTGVPAFRLIDGL